jgi:hypothetical protein
MQTENSITARFVTPLNTSSSMSHSSVSFTLPQPFIGGTINLKQLLAQWSEILRLGQSAGHGDFLADPAKTATTRDKMASPWLCERVTFHSE